MKIIKILIAIIIFSFNFSVNAEDTAFKEWLKNQNFDEIYFKKNKFILFQKLEYLRLVYLLIHNKKINLIYSLIYKVMNP